MAEVDSSQNDSSDTEIRAEEQKQAIVKFLIVLLVIFVLYYSSGISDGI